MLAVYGSGAAKRSYDEKLRILNIDIGGGSTKLGLVQNGELIATAAVHLGGRLMVVNEKMCSPDSILRALTLPNKQALIGH